MHENKKSASKKSLESSTGSKNGKQQKLFDDDEGSDSDMNEGMSKLKINKQFEGPKGEKVCLFVFLAFFIGVNTSQILSFTKGVFSYLLQVLLHVIQSLKTIRITKLKNCFNSFVFFVEDFHIVQDRPYFFLMYF